MNKKMMAYVIGAAVGVVAAVFVPSLYVQVAGLLGKSVEEI